MKQHLLDVAEITDAYRTFPRMFLCLFYTILVDTHYWYINLPDPSLYQSTYITAVWAAVAAVTKFYVDTGRKWTTSS